MDLPIALIQAIDQLIEPYSLKEVAQAAQQLSERYRSGKKSHFETELDCLAYLCTRLPATYAAIRRVFEERQTPPGSIVDFGAGLGTSVWAVPEATSFHLVEQDPLFQALGQKLTHKQGVTWQQGDLTTLDPLPEGDLYLFSYSLGEIDPSLYPKFLPRFFEKAKKEIVIIEPGTPTGFERIRTLRTLFLKWGGHLVAPCPHEKACPMEGKNWCHFAQRLPRTPWHRQLKGGTLGYEDEKFSYLIVSKKRCHTTKNRILRTPQKKKGHVIFEVCTENGIQKKVITKKEKEFYKNCKKLMWGDII